jgi:hypothetical protein
VFTLALIAFLPNDDAGLDDDDDDDEDDEEEEEEDILAKEIFFPRVRPEKKRHRNSTNTVQ